MDVAIAVSVERDGGLEGPICPQFGRAPRFLVLRPGDAAPESLANGAAGDAHGAGTGAAALVARAGAKAVISGRFGPRAVEALRALGVAMWIAPPGMSAGDAVEKCRRGELQPFEIRTF